MQSILRLVCLQFFTLLFDIELDYKAVQCAVYISDMLKCFLSFFYLFKHFFVFEWEDYVICSISDLFAEQKDVSSLLNCGSNNLKTCDFTS